MKAAVIVFPGSNCSRDVQRTLEESVKARVEMVWHESEHFDGDPDLVVLPGGYSYGDYLRSGAIAAKSPIIGALKEHAKRGGLVLGICNGFQVLTETGLLPGALLPNRSLTFMCKKCYVRVEHTNNQFTAGLKKGEVLQLPIAHSEGLFFLPDEDLKRLEDQGRVIFRYADPKTGEAGVLFAPNGALNGIAGICNEKGNVLGMMPHPERAAIPHLNAGIDGIKFWTSIAGTIAKRGGF